MKSYCLTDVGVKRNMNQDFVYASDQPVGHLPNLFIVADGMGGHNAGDLASRIDFRVMNAEEMTFEDGSFDVIFSRWLTWLLPRPEKAYCEWLRVLSDDGIILIYDGNNSRHFYDKQAEEEYKKQERQLTYKDKDGHLLPPEFYEKLDENVKNIAMTYIVRPYWDRCIFNAYGAEVYIDEKVMETIIPDFVNGNTATMEVFLVKAGKKAVL